MADNTESTTEPDSDGDNTADYLELDSDNDGCKDVAEAGYKDANGDGIQDQHRQHLIPMEQQIQREQVQEDTIHRLILMAIVLPTIQKLDQTMHQQRQ